MFSNTPPLPPKPINHIPKPAPIIQPPLRMPIQRLHRRQVLVIPDGRENVPGGVEAVLGGGVVVLEHRKKWRLAVVLN